jgi:uncharacterized protein YeaO (DUF488 family)
MVASHFLLSWRRRGAQGARRQGVVGAVAKVLIRRAYQAADPGEGVAVLIDRLWPRGIAKAAASWGQWLRDVAPSTELRRWYGHRPERFAEFERRYREELAATEAAAGAVARLRALAAAGPLTLVTAVRELDLSHAEVLRRVIANPSRGGRGRSEQEG